MSKIIGDAMLDAVRNLAAVKGKRYAEGANAVAAIYVTLAENNLLRDPQAVLAARSCTCAFHRIFEVAHATFMSDVQMLLDVHSSATSAADSEQGARQVLPH